MRHIYPVVLGLMLILLPAAARADEAPDALDAFNKLYGDDLARVRATADTADDVALAQKLLAAAKTTANQPALMALLCDKAWELTKSVPAAHSIAIEAMDLEMQQLPDRRAACLEKRVAVRQAQYDAKPANDRAGVGKSLLADLMALADLKAADDSAGAIALYRKALTIAAAAKPTDKPAIQAKLDSLAARQKLEDKIGLLKARFQVNPADTAARADLVKTLLVDMDNPAEAAKFIDASVDPMMQKYVPAAAKPIDSAPETACMELGDWYRGLAAQASASAKPALVARAKTYYERFLTLHTANDTPRAQATLAMQKAGDLLPKPPPYKGPPQLPDKLMPGTWLELIPFIDLKRELVTGAIVSNLTRQGPNLVVTDGSGATSSHTRILTPAMPVGDYQVGITFQMPSSSTRSFDNVEVLLPIGKINAFFNVSVNGRILFGAMNNTMNISANSPPIKLGVPHTLLVKVVQSQGQVDLSAELDGQSIFHWTGKESDFDPKFGLPDNRLLGLTVDTYKTVAFSSIRLQMLSGEATFLPSSSTP